jgi:hypothetical protein
LPAPGTKQQGVKNSNGTNYTRIELTSLVRDATLVLLLLLGVLGEVHDATDREERAHGEAELQACGVGTCG